MRRCVKTEQNTAKTAPPTPRNSPLITNEPEGNGGCEEATPERELLTLCGAHGGQGRRRQQAHLTQLQGMLPVQGLTLGRRRRRTLEKTTGGLGTIEIT